MGEGVIEERYGELLDIKEIKRYEKDGHVWFVCRAVKV